MSLVSAICLGGPFDGQEFEIETSPAVIYLSAIQQEMALLAQDCVTYVVDQVDGDWVLRWPA